MINIPTPDMLYHIDTLPSDPEKSLALGEQLAETIELATKGKKYDAIGFMLEDDLDNRDQLEIYARSENILLINVIAGKEAIIPANVEGNLYRSSNGDINFILSPKSESPLITYQALKYGLTKYYGEATNGEAMDDQTTKSNKPPLLLMCDYELDGFDEYCGFGNDSENEGNEFKKLHKGTNVVRYLLTPFDDTFGTLKAKTINTDIQVLIGSAADSVFATQLDRGIGKLREEIPPFVNSHIRGFMHVKGKNPSTFRTFIGTALNRLRRNSK